MPSVPSFLANDVPSWPMMSPCAQCPLMANDVPSFMANDVPSFMANDVPSWPTMSPRGRCPFQHHHCCPMSAPHPHIPVLRWSPPPPSPIKGSPVPVSPPIAPPPANPILFSPLFGLFFSFLFEEKSAVYGDVASVFLFVCLFVLFCFVFPNDNVISF